LGCELSVCALAGCAISTETLTPLKIGETRFILLEFPDDEPSVDWEFLVSDIKCAGFHVIIAHPERYRYIAKDYSLAQSLLNYGCELQLDAQSFLNGRFSTERRTAIKLLESGSVSYIASDAHRPNDYETYFAIRRHLGKNWPSDGLLEKLI
jgi:tyrosine-protein phosphatase YwqE